MRYSIPIKRTTYRGIAFRSRLEARWAIFFDALPISYQYEPPSSGDLSYLPDFHIPHQEGFPREMYVEVKPSSYGRGDLYKPDLLAYHGVPVGFLHELVLPKSMHDGCVHEMLFGGAWDESHGFCQCSRCGAFGFEFEGRSERIACPCDIPEEHTDSGPALVQAYAIALSYKFDP